MDHIEKLRNALSRVLFDRCGLRPWDRGPQLRRDIDQAKYPSPFTPSPLSQMAREGNNQHSKERKDGNWISGKYFGIVRGCASAPGSRLPSRSPSRKSCSATGRLVRTPCRNTGRRCSRPTPRTATAPPHTVGAFAFVAPCSSRRRASSCSSHAPAYRSPTSVIVGPSKLLGSVSSIWVEAAR